jgi:hypothetical protein
MEITFSIPFLFNLVSLLQKEANRMDLNYSGKLERSDPLSLLNSLTLQKKKNPNYPALEGVIR